MKSSLSTRLFVAGALVAAAVAGCVAQPAQQCQVAQPSSAILGLPQFWVQYKLQTGTGACANLTGEEVGFQTYTDIKDDDNVKIAIRASGLGAMWSGNAQDVPRVDPEDPTGKKINSVFKLTPFPDPDTYVCKNAEDVPPAEQNFQAENYDFELPDGGTEARSLPAELVRYAWQNPEWLSSPSVPGQAFHATLQYTVDVCTATYEATGIWPLTSCVTDLDCSPNPVPDAGVCDDTDNCPSDQLSDPVRRIIGSGLNPDFKVKCDTDNGVCVLAVPFSELVEAGKRQ